MRTILAILSACTLALAGTGCSSRDHDSPPPPGSGAPPAGTVWTEPGATSVGPGGTVTVRVMVSTDAALLGSYSMRITYNSSAFTLQSVAGGSSKMGDPYMTDTASPGTVFMCDMNTANPDEGAAGVLEVAVLTFQATGSAGSQLGLAGQVLNLADVDYPAADIGSSPLPRNITAGQDVVIE